VNYERNKKGSRFFETQCTLIHNVKSATDALTIAKLALISFHFKPCIFHVAAAAAIIIM